jgi:hypothetical protein
MATQLGTPSISDVRPQDWRAVATAVSNIRQRIQALESSLGLTSSMAQSTSSTTTTNLNTLLTQLAALTARVTALESAASTDIEEFIAGETIAAGQCVVPISATGVGVADPSNNSRMFGLIGVATTAAVNGAIVFVQRRGLYTVAGASGFQAGQAVYVDSLGGITQTPDYDATALPLGVAVSATQIFIAPIWPALLYPTYSSGIEDAFEDYLPITLRAAQALAPSLEAQIAALPFSSGLDPTSEVPVLIGSTAVRVAASDFGGGGGGGGTAGTLDFTIDGTLSADSDALLPTEKAVKTYADTAIATAIAGLSWKQEVRAATTVDGTLATAYVVGAVIDNVTLALGDRILLKNQTLGQNNGIYTVNLIGAPTRSIDANTGPELVSAACSVSEGTANADTAWTCTTISPIVVGTTPLVWAAAPAGTITALNGDVTASGTGNVTATLATVNSNIGAYTYAAITVNAKGLVTAAASGTAPITTITAGVGISISGAGNTIKATTGYTRGAGWGNGTYAIAAPTNDVTVTAIESGTIVSATVVGLGGPGSCVIDVWKTTYAAAPPTVSNSITSTHKPTITSASKSQDTTLTGWTTSVTAGDVLVFHLSSCSVFTAVSIILEIDP